MTAKIFGSVETPCMAGWENMQGDERVRFCETCQLHVHNLSEMTDMDVVDLIERTKGGRLCVRMLKREDGTVYTDNCPYRLRRVRNAVRRWAPWVLLAVAFVFGQSAADAQGLVGADPRFGNSNEVGGGLGDYGYDTARDISRVVTALSTIPAALIAMWRLRTKVGVSWPRSTGCAKHRVKDHPWFRYSRWSVWRVVEALFIFWLIPTTIHLIGTFSINNYGGLAWAY